MAFTKEISIIVIAVSQRDKLQYREAERSIWPAMEIVI